MTVKVSKPAINVREELADLKKPTGIAGEAMLAAETPQEQFNLIGAGRRRLTINGDMRIAQRGTSATGVTGNGYYATDRMNFYKTNTGTYTISQSTDAPSGFTYSHKVVSTTGDSSLGSTDLVSPLFYSIEGQDLQHLGYGTTDGKYITLSFWVKTNVTGTYSVSFYKTHSSPRVCAPLYTITRANTWQYVSLTVSSDSVGIANGTGGGLYLYFNTTVGSTYNSQPTTAWAAYNSSNWAGGHTAYCFASNNDSWQITGVQLEVGKVATPFEHRSYGEELALCQRYYIRRTVDDDNDYPGLCTGWLSTSGTHNLITQLEQQMRSSPTFSSSGNFRAQSAVDTANSSSLSAANISPIALRIALAGASYSGTTGDFGILQGKTTGGYIAFDAEL